PLIVDVYPLSGGSSLMHPLFANQAWAAMGYVVFSPSPPAPIGWQNAWKGTDSNRAALGLKGWRITTDHVQSGIQLLADQGIIDRDRVCIFGFSNGGGVAAKLLSMLAKIRCAIIVAPAFADWIRPEALNGLPLREYAGFPLSKDWTDRIAMSSVFDLAGVTTPTLIFAGDDDGDFVLDAIELYQGLRRAKTDVTLVRYPGQGHLFTGAALQDYWDRSSAFLKKHLGATQETVTKRLLN
ncbi:MAG TPA: prolyl oligopeptidase family serine peptidase, partial [Sphingomicrobium sp.]|nr:prolyl oligopeptidase family serine peptidase [Sphingomicrobium sp.]